MRILQAIATSMKIRHELHQCHLDDFLGKVSSARAGRVPRTAWLVATHIMVSGSARLAFRPESARMCVQ